MTDEERDAIVAKLLPSARGKDRLGLVIAGVMLGEIPPDPVLKPLCESVLHALYMKKREARCPVCGVRLMTA